MKKALGAIPAIFPMPVLMVAAYDENGKVNVMNAAWGMISDMKQITLFLSEDHKTTANILATKAFTVALADKDHMDVADFFGIASGNTMKDKFERTGYTAVKSAFVNAPVIEEFPVVMECDVLDENGKIEPAKVNALIFDQFKFGYYTVGEKVGQAWNAGKEWMKK